MDRTEIKNPLLAVGSLISYLFLKTNVKKRNIYNIGIVADEKQKKQV